MRHIFLLIRKTVFLLLLVGILFSYAMFQGGFVSWFLFYSVTPLVLYVLILLFYPFSKWKVERSISNHILRSGDALIAEVKLTRKIPFPLFYCVVEEMLPKSLEKKNLGIEMYKYMGQPKAVYEPRSIKRVLFPGFKRSFSFRYGIEGLPRGEHHLQAIRVKMGDIFGFVKKEHYFEVYDAILVYPKFRKLSMNEKAHSFEEGVAPSYNINLKDTTVVSGVREYAPGDRVSWIDWKTTARKNSVMTKEFEKQKSFDMLYILDATSHSANNEIVFEGAVELSASLLDALRKQTSELAFMTIGKQRTYFPIQRDVSKQDKINQHLAKLTPSGNVPFGQAIIDAQRSLPSGLITLLATSNLSRETKETIGKLRFKSSKIVLFYIQAKDRISEEQHQLLAELRSSGVIVNLMTEDKFLKQTFEVST
ncbi:DUF58 domain-containing protein [Bacillaceae bacterium S4-13-58]